jgi:hypothetical protein
MTSDRNVGTPTSRSILEDGLSDTGKVRVLFRCRITSSIKLTFIVYKLHEMADWLQRTLEAKGPLDHSESTLILTFSPPGDPKGIAARPLAKDFQKIRTITSKSSVTYGIGLPDYIIVGRRGTCP